MNNSPAPIDPTHAILGAEPVDLSPRELDVIRLVTNGYSNDDIAKLLFLSINSVKTYIRGAYRKIGATTRTHAVLWGVRHGLLEELDPAPAPRHLSAVL